jgi:CubicO group peptidase (beta-lactamase class C family)
VTTPSGTDALIHASGPARTLVERPEPLLELPVRGVDGSSKTVVERLVETLTDAFLVLHDGVLVLEWYADSVVRETPHAVMSVTKSVVGCVAGVLVARGRLEPDQPVTRWVPEVATTGYAGVTIRDLLDMRTGRDYRESHEDVDGEVAQLGRCLTSEHSQGLHDLVLGSSRIGVHDGPFCYRSLDTELLGWVLERVARKPLPELVEQTILTPLGVEFDATLALDAQGTASASGGLGLTARDAARFAQMLLDGGAVGRRQVVPTEWIKDIRIGAGDSVDAFSQRVAAGLAAEVPSPPSAMYRNQFWVSEQGGHKFLALGVYGQYIHVDGDAGTAVVKLSSWTSPQDPERFTDGLACAEAVADHLGGSSTPRISLYS